MHFSPTLPAWLASLSLVVTAAGSPTESSLQPRKALKNVRYPGVPQSGGYGDNWASLVNTAGPREWLKNLTDFHNRDFYSDYGVEAGQWLYTLAMNLAAPNPAIVGTSYAHKYSRQESFVITIPGKHPEISVVVATNFDATTGNVDARAPGADDNGSAVVTHLEALRILAEQKYQGWHNIEFHFYAGTRAGHVGSRDVMAAYYEADRKIIAYLDQSQTGFGSSTRRVTVCQEFSYEPLEDYVIAIIEKYSLVEPDYELDCRGGNHATAFNHHHPTIHVTGKTAGWKTRPNDAKNDGYESVNWLSVQRHAMFTMQFLAEASNA
ncbi:hypothetical protein QTJ16_006034 [Diplocarpon rosae]|uniref:Peptide hydrolase n=1 Tax=Diplocarpon rosae TaxID=946125 RepID=A0AAD9WCY5_9HELO|nr:hypothetical protein QTJ16_006034 [Diplocarpon rosae]